MAPQIKVRTSKSYMTLKIVMKVCSWFRRTIPINLTLKKSCVGWVNLRRKCDGWLVLFSSSNRKNKIVQRQPHPVHFNHNLLFTMIGDKRNGLSLKQLFYPIAVWSDTSRDEQLTINVSEDSQGRFDRQRDVNTPCLNVSFISPSGFSFKIGMQNQMRKNQLWKSGTNIFRNA